jgi:hypothetical protein
VEKAAVDLLRNAGLSNARSSRELSEVAQAMSRIRYEYGVDYAGPLSGFRRGLYQINGKQLLVVRSYEVIKPRLGQWPILATFLRGLLGREQTLEFLYWLKLAYEALADETRRRPGQALVFAGPPDCGKSFLQNHVITPVLGGRACRCYRYLAGRTEFNGDMFEAEHLIVDDDVPFGKYQERMALGSRIKSIVASELHSAHYKFQDAFSVQPFWRLSISVNDSPESLLVLPPIDESLEDKLIIFKAQSFPLPMPTETQEERDAFRDAISSELPAMLYRMTRTPIPESFAGRRFGLAHFHHPDIIKAVQELSPEERLLSIIDTVLFKTFLPNPLVEPGSMEAWEGTAGELEARLVASNFAREAEKVLSWNNACGTYLGHLAKRHPDRVVYHRTNSDRFWIIKPPVV